MNRHPDNALFHVLKDIEDSQKAFRKSNEAFAKWWKSLPPGTVVDINALDPFDPVHLRNSYSRAERDYDGDMGREQDDVDEERR